MEPRVRGPAPAAAPGRPAPDAPGNDDGAARLPGSPGTEGGAAAEPQTGVVVEVEGPDGTRHELTARYVIAADGTGSPVRTNLGIGFQGATNAQTFFVIDGYGVEGLEPGSASGSAAQTSCSRFPWAPATARSGTGWSGSCSR